MLGFFGWAALRCGGVRASSAIIDRREMLLDILRDDLLHLFPKQPDLFANTYTSSTCLRQRRIDLAICLPLW